MAKYVYYIYMYVCAYTVCSYVLDIQCMYLCVCTCLFELNNWIAQLEVSIALVYLTVGVPYWRWTLL